ncbi:unnamed protein product [Rotaria sp. Silwood1]|nr:unnamed protein product [Rotaria sp. Silwood1]CAF1226736.1 unnamed protein product [Rotaria sp. Silwood1]CAF1254558.1 unnamed protein product [Rotaria sp. Silwood1]CAF3442925.1 unnamed protein product [Rotaria sp. Silwood1]CAF3499834.1 unnamed protein product [Rotaria sp. Silwood1]
MIRGKIFIYVLLVTFVIQAQISVGYPTNPDNLQELLKQALEVNYCARMVPVMKPIPIRFRRSTNKNQFQCIITLD